MSEVSSVSSPKSLFPIKMALGCLAVIAMLLAYVVYQVMAHPASNGRVVGFIPLVAIVVMMMSLATFSLFLKADAMSGKSLLGWFAIAFVELAMMSQLFPLSMSQLELSRARANIDGRVPAVAAQASSQLRAQPWNTMAAVATLRPALVGASATSEFALFQNAARSGLLSPSVQRVLANGVVTRADKEDLLSELLASAANEPNPRLVALADQLRGGSLPPH